LIASRRERERTWSVAFSVITLPLNESWLEVVDSGELGVEVPIDMAELCDEDGDTRDVGFVCCPI
jgi:hypothetical protein